MGCLLASRPLNKWSYFEYGLMFSMGLQTKGTREQNYATQEKESSVEVQFVTFVTQSVVLNVDFAR